MKLKKMLLVGLASLSLGTVGIISQPTRSQAMSIYNPDNPFWLHSHWITTTKRIVVHKIKYMEPEYKSYQVASYVVPRGYHYKIYASATNYHWFFDSGKFKSNAHYMYVSNRHSHDWFRFGIH
ncbi:hypothetical protein ABC657_08850 [Lentilactobacillus parabuchneri]|uniref:hypothetical protein n=1 Tax=Lentilactobacillus parabuchneri TaxID=152331 RepID=UPI0031DD2497